MSGEQSATGDCGAQCNSNVDGEGGVCVTKTLYRSWCVTIEGGA